MRNTAFFTVGTTEFEQILSYFTCYCCRFIRNTNALTLPGSETLRVLTRPFRTDPGFGPQQKTTLQNLFATLSEKERIVYLHMDEINTKPAYSFVGGRVSTSSECQKF